MQKARQNNCRALIEFCSCPLLEQVHPGTIDYSRRLQNSPLSLVSTGAGDIGADEVPLQVAGRRGTQRRRQYFISWAFAMIPGMSLWFVPMPLDWGIWGTLSPPRGAGMSPLMPNSIFGVWDLLALFPLL